MSQERPEQTPADGRALLAFRLGWVTAELLGHIRKGYQPRQRPPHGDDYTPRLSVGDGRPSNKGEELWLAARRLADLGEALALLPEPQAPDALQPVQCLPAEFRRWLEGGELAIGTPAALRELLNDWSLDAWSRLHVQDDALARALTAGMSLADTYWCLRSPPPSGTEDTRLAREKWYDPLSSYRLDEQRRRLREIASDLPTGISDALRRHLRHWSIGTELYRDHQQQLRRFAWLYRRSHPLGFLHRRPPARPVQQLSSAEEQAIQDALERQAAVWRDLVFGLRTPDSYLYARERPWVVWLARALFLLLLALPLAAITVSLLSLASVWLGGVAVPNLLNAIQGSVVQSPTTGWSDLLKLLSTLLATIGTFVVTIRPLVNWLQEAYEQIHHEVTVHLVTRRTLASWDRELRKMAR